MRSLRTESRPFQKAKRNTGAGYDHEAGETILVPTIGARARVLVGEVLPRLAVGAVVFAYRAPGPLTDVRPDRSSSLPSVYPATSWQPGVPQTDRGDLACPMPAMAMRLSMAAAAT